MTTFEERLESFGPTGKALFLRYVKDAELHDIGQRRIEKFRTDAVIASTMTGMTLSAMLKDKAGFEEAIRRINKDTTYSWWSKSDAKRTLGSLYCFVHFKTRYVKSAPFEIRELAYHKKKSTDKRMARAIITREEVRELSKLGAMNAMDSALLWTLFESAARIGEFIQLTIKDVQPIEEGMVLRIPPGKTGEREVVLVEAGPFLSRWMEKHPSSKNAGTHLWVRAKSGKRLTGPAIAKRLRVMAERLNEYRKKNGMAPFLKDVNPHNFRHSRASELGGEPGMTEQILCRVMGWELSSGMPRVYLHLSPEMVRRAQLRVYGKAKEEEEKGIITSWVCPKCGAATPLENRFCGTCGGDKEAKVLPSKIEALEEQVRDLQRQINKMMPAAIYGVVMQAKKKTEEEKRLKSQSSE